MLGGKGFRPATDRREGHDAPRFNELHLQSNGMTLEGVTSLAQPLQRWIEMRVLDLGRNPLWVGVVVLAKVLPSTLRCLHLPITRCGDVGFAALAAAFPRLPHLHELNVAGNGAGDEGFVALAGALPTLKSLMELNVSYNPGGTRGWKALAGALPSMPELRDLDARGPPMVIGVEGAKALSYALRDARCPQLRVLRVRGSDLGAGGRAALEAVSRESRGTPGTSLGQTAAETLGFDEIPDPVPESWAGYRSNPLIQCRVSGRTDTGVIDPGLSVWFDSDDELEEDQIELCVDRWRLEDEGCYVGRGERGGCSCTPRCRTPMPADDY